jgi:hypothetical protein
MTLQKPARTTDPVDALIRKAWERRKRHWGWLHDDAIADIAGALGLTSGRVWDGLERTDHPLDRGFNP